MFLRIVFSQFFIAKIKLLGKKFIFNSYVHVIAIFFSVTIICFNYSKRNSTLSLSSLLMEILSKNKLFGSGFLTTSSSSSSYSSPSTSSSALTSYFCDSSALSLCFFRGARGYLRGVPAGVPRTICR